MSEATFAQERPAVPLLIVRHGQQERSGDNGPLMPIGHQQAALTAQAIGLTDRDRLIASTLQRAVTTAAAFGRAPEQIKELDEFRFGDSWTWAHSEAQADLSLWRPDDRMPGGESLREFQTRVDAALTALLADPPDGRPIVVVHSGVIDAVLRWVFGLGPDSPWTTEAEVGLASITEVQHWPRGRTVTGAPRHSLLVRLGDISHLPQHLTTGWPVLP